MPGGDRPKELYIDEKWDRAIDVSLRRVVYGTLAGGTLALLLFSKPLLVASLNRPPSFGKPATAFSRT